MRVWLAGSPLRTLHAQSTRRLFSSQRLVENVRVRCASSGDITLSLHNVSQSNSSSPLLIYLPPFFHPGSDSGPGPVLPKFLKSFPTAVINYRWPASSLDPNVPAASRHDGEGSKPAPPLLWPTPLHDMLFGYSWIVKNLSPSDSSRRDVYVYGSYLGAGLAAALALTECYPHQQMAIRGLIAYNGIYNWTTFYPDHPIHKYRSEETLLSDAPDHPGSMFHYLKQRMPALFPSPGDAFDPFASPSLFFHNPPLLVPDNFYASTATSSFQKAVDELSLHPLNTENQDLATPLKAPRKGYLAFPPRTSPLKIPEALLLHETPPPPTRPARTRRSSGAVKKRRGWGENSFEVQATELASLMRRSVEKLELKERMKWDEDVENWDDEAEKRVQVADVGRADAEAEIGVLGHDLIEEWLDERTGRVDEG